jgi:hypothetical protein
MSLRAIDTLRELDGVQIHASIEPRVFDELESQLGFGLPTEHKEILCWSNSLEIYAGYFRLFGLGANSSTDSVLWNQQEHWKFAWRDRCSAHWCFGETAWGDQYAYSLESLRSNRTAEVYFLDALSMTSEMIAGSFSEFLETELLRSAREPYDQLVCLARKKLGPLDSSSHLVYMPSLLLGGTEAIENVQTMNARAAMICNGDLAIQLDEGPPNGTVKTVQPYQDTDGRMRLRLGWK